MQIFSVPIASLQLDPANNRLHSAPNLEAIMASLQRFGQQKPVVITQTGLVLAGNGTLEAARALGWSHLACVQTELLGPDQRAYAIADNRTTDLSEFDNGRLSEELRGLGAIDPQLLAAAGFTADELAQLDGLAQIGPAADAAPAGRLADRFLVPPFSVLDARQGYWQDRKRYWLNLGIQSELGRGQDSSPGGSPRPAMRLENGKTVRGDGAGRKLAPGGAPMPHDRAAAQRRAGGA